MRKILFALVLGFLIISCDTAMVKSSYVAIDDASWEKDSILEFTFSGLDSLASHDVFINVRNDNTFLYNNLFLIAELSAPDGVVVKDTLEYSMAEPDGTWLGKGYGSIKENKLWYKEDIVFPETGVYTLRISHAMRKNGSVDGMALLEGITDVGFEIVKK